ncbi:MAG: TlyA family RNA methyltransferase [Propionibacteriaceae bacterium]|nr:TlyA family RNA methyltransferase [Propionibacteriaceae bacterium]
MRLDSELAHRGLARSRSHGRQLIDSGRVHLAGNPELKPSTQVSAESIITVDTDHYVSRAAHKLIHALDRSQLTVPSRVLDVGASTGGFTQVLLERGAQRVYAIDVGHGQLVEEIRHDPRVVVREGLNVRNLVVDDVEDEQVDLVVIDVSFISVKMVIAPVRGVVRPGGHILVLVKPQFEVGRSALDSRGIVMDAHHRDTAISEVINSAQDIGCMLVWSEESVVVGEFGNQETFCLFQC